MALSLFRPDMMPRRTLGFAAIGVAPREPLVRASLQLLDTLEAAAPQARAALGKLARGEFARPEECQAGHREMREALELAEGDDEDHQRPGPRG